MRKRNPDGTYQFNDEDKARIAMGDVPVLYDDETGDTYWMPRRVAEAVRQITREIGGINPDNFDEFMAELLPIIATDKDTVQ